MDSGNAKAVAAMISVFCALCCQADSVLAEEMSAEQLYENAFRLIVEGDYGEAYDRLNEIIARYPGTVYARFAQDRKRRLEELNLPSIRRKKIDQSGRVESVVFSTLYSTWLGIGSARLADAESLKAVAGGMMIGAPVGLFTSLALTRNARLSKGQAALINFSGYWGTWQGIGLAILLDDNDDEKSIVGSAMAGGVLGILTTSALTRKFDLSLGDAGIINYGGIWGTWLSFCAAAIGDVERDDAGLGIMLLGGNLGMAAMAAISPRTRISFVRASLINLSGIVGTIAAGGLLLIVGTDSEDKEAAFATLMSGGILGLVAGGFGTAGIGGEALQEPDHERLGWDTSSRRYEPGSEEMRMSLFSVKF